MIDHTTTNDNTSKAPTRRSGFVIGAALLVPLFLAGCNTVSGLGEDVEAAGDAIEKSAEKNKGY
ncbi:MAG: entericidin A/B family lipoprotein [Gammaproteobacteria bacterium]|nr:entericidin A/B family lipoprotein [Gammaproteobacteria bacterium]